VTSGHPLANASISTIMSIPTTEIIIFETAEAHRENITAAIAPVFDIVYKADGCHRCVSYFLALPTWQI